MNKNQLGEVEEKTGIFYMFAPLKPSIVKKLLVIRFSSIGDIVLTSALLRCLKEQHPDIELHYLTKAAFSDLVSTNPHVDKVHCLRGRLRDLLPALKEENYDFIVDLHNNLRSKIVKLSLRAPSAAFPKLNIRKWLIVNARINLLPPVHLITRYFRAAKSLNVQYDGKGSDFFLPKQLMPNHEKHLPPGLTSGYMAVVAGGHHKTKQIPPEKLVSICNNAGLPVVFLGSKADIQTAEKVKEALKVNAINLCGKFSLHGSASFLKRAKVVISPDTGLMHIAAALKKPMVTLWGNTIPQFGMTPFYPDKLKGLHTIHQATGLPCRPCSKTGFERCPLGHFDCMYQISDNEVVNSIKAMATTH